MEALPAAGDALPPDVLGVASRLTSPPRGPVAPLPHGQKLFPVRNRRRPTRGIVPCAEVRLASP